MVPPDSVKGEGSLSRFLMKQISDRSDGSERRALLRQYRRIMPNHRPPTALRCWDTSSVRRAEKKPAVRAVQKLHSRSEFKCAIVCRLASAGRSRKINSASGPQDQA